MKASVTVVIAKCEFTYIQLAASMTMLVLCAQAWIAGSTNSPTPCSIRITSRAFWNASATLPSVAPRTSR